MKLKYRFEIMGRSKLIKQAYKLNFKNQKGRKNLI
jgi:hypothetical protein